MSIALNIKSISKSFPGVRALDDVSFTVNAGSVHALVGENGAGKSTLIKILSGVYQTDEGTVDLFDQPFKAKDPFTARQHGISVVHQELKLVEQLSVKENIFLGNPPMGPFGVNYRKMEAEAKKLLDYLGVSIDPNRIVQRLTVAQQQIVEIAKAINFNARVIIMDEPSATLTESEIEVLFRVIRELHQKGITILYISHRLEEIFNISDTVTILRDGQHIATVPTSTVDREKLISMMVGREMGMEYPERSVSIGDVVLRVNNLTRKGVFEDISFELSHGEILGFAGLVGSGRTEVARALFGADKTTSGSIELNGQTYRPSDVSHAIESNIGLVPEDRKRQGLVQAMTVRNNISLANFESIMKGGLISGRKEEELAQNYIKKLRIVTPSAKQKAKYLSGGNQQKVVIAKWLNADTDILIIDEPTRGIDVGAKQEIYVLINSLVAQGKSIIMVSSEMNELLGMCDRILVMHEGRKTGELKRNEFSQERILDLATG